MRSFYPPETFRGPIDGYNLLPFRFRRLPSGRELLVNEVGEYLILPVGSTSRIVRRKIKASSPLFRQLKAKQFIFDSSSSGLLGQLALKYRAKRSYLDEFTQLHIFVTTLRCEHSCPYCQVSRQCQDKSQFDMSKETIERSLALMARCPSKALTLEIQGGEPLLNFDGLQYLITRAKESLADRNLRCVVATNLTLLTEEHLDFFQKHSVDISTSLDGPAKLHNKNRPNLGKSSHSQVVDKIAMARRSLGDRSVSALMTTTKESLSMHKEIIDEYVAQGFRSIFLRRLSPYGFATKTKNSIGYDIRAFWKFYREGLDYIIALNREGVYIEEAYASIALSKILTPFSNGYVDLQSPAGAGISVIVYNYDGDVYATDESRMLAEMGDDTFRLGNVHDSSFEEIFGNDKLWTIAQETCLETSPGCSDCGFLSYCGADPLFHYTTQGSLSGMKAESDFCWFHQKLFDYLFELLDQDEGHLMRIFFAWIRELDHSEMKEMVPS